MCSCSPSITHVPLKNDYDKIKKVYYSEKSKDDVWDMLVKLFARKGYGIKIIDKSSGLIVAENADFADQRTFEDEKGKMYHPERYLVCSYYEDGLSQITPAKIRGSWNVLVSVIDSKTFIEINLTNIEAYDYGFGNPQILRPSMYRFTIKSTGVFEKEIADYIK